ncbi:MAG: nucleoside deaminase [Candidatus Nomurabacteria bacterium]|nr:nucleoside deaminase [Candidatus Nomurabacteria bacterium]
MQNHPQENIMKKAIEEAKSSASAGQYALGAVVVNADGEVIAITHTTLHENNDPTCHAEVNVIRLACTKLKDRYLKGCWLYSTLEPCPMCTSAAIWAKMEGIVFGASKEDAQDFAKNLKDSKFTWRQIDVSARDIVEKGDPKIKLIEKFMREECLELFNFSKSS